MVIRCSVLACGLVPSHPSPRAIARFFLAASVTTNVPCGKSIAACDRLTVQLEHDPLAQPARPDHRPAMGRSQNRLDGSEKDGAGGSRIFRIGRPMIRGSNAYR